jgi:hypothetical protein
MKGKSIFEFKAGDDIVSINSHFKYKVIKVTEKRGKNDAYVTIKGEQTEEIKIYQTNKIWALLKDYSN